MNINTEGNSEEQFSETTEEPLMIFLGEGSGKELNVGNEEKKKIFFFGQPGCLKHSPIRTNTPDNHNNHNKPPNDASVTKVATKLFPEMENSKTPENEATDDDDNSDLLQRITDAINEGKEASAEPEKLESHCTTSKDEALMEISQQTTQINNSSDLKVNEAISKEIESEREESLSNVEEKVKKSVECSEASNLKEVPQTINNEAVKSEDQELSEKSLQSFNKDSKKSEYKSKSVQIIMKSIVPYDDDSTSSSSHAEGEKDKEVAADESNTSEMPLKENSAFKSSETDTKLEGTEEQEKEIKDELESSYDKPDEPSELNADCERNLSSENEISEVSEKPKIMIQEDSVKASAEEIKTILVQREESPVRSPSPEVSSLTIKETEAFEQKAEPETQPESLTIEDSQSENMAVKEESTSCQSIEPILEPGTSQHSVEISAKTETVESHLVETNFETNAKKSSENIQPSEAYIETVIDNDIEDSTIAETTLEDSKAKYATDQIDIEEKCCPAVMEEKVVESENLDEEINEGCEIKLPNFINEETKTPTVDCSDQPVADEPMETELLNKKEEALHESSIDHESQPLDYQEKISGTSEEDPEETLASEIASEPLQNDPEVDTAESDNAETVGEEIVQPREKLLEENIQLTQDVNTASQLVAVEEKEKETIGSPEKTELGERLKDDFSPTVLESFTQNAVNEQKNFNDNLDKPENECENSQELTIKDSDGNTTGNTDVQLKSSIDNEVKPTEILEKNNDVDLQLPAQQEEEKPTCIIEKEEHQTPKELDKVIAEELKDEVKDSSCSTLENEETTMENQKKQTEQFNDEENINSPDDFNDYQDGAASDIVSEGSDSEDNTEKVTTNDIEEPHEIESHVKLTKSDEIPVELTKSNEIVEESQAHLDLSMPAKLTENQSLPTEPEEVIESLRATSLERIEKLAVNDSPTKAPSTETFEKEVPENLEVKKLVEVETSEKSSKSTKPLINRKRKISEQKSLSESESEGNVVAESVSNASEDEEVVVKKKPRMRGKITQRKTLPARKSARNIEDTKKTEIEVKAAVDKKCEIEVKTEKLSDETAEVDSKKELNDESKVDTEQTLQNFKFDYDESDDIVAKVAAIRTMISKEPVKETTSEKSEDEDSDRKVSNKRTVRTKRGRAGKKNDVESSSDEDSAMKSEKTDSKRSKPSDESKDQTTPNKKKRETGPKGLLKYIDTSLVIETVENEAPVRMSRRIAQQKIREETERRQMEEKMLKQMKAEAEKKKKGGSDDDADPDADVEEEEDDQKGSSADGDESFKGSPRKKKSKINPSDKQWQTSSSHSEHSESEDYLEHVPSDPGSPLFRSDHEFSPESDDEDAAQIQPLKRARTAKKLGAVAASDEDEDINPNHACQVCHKTDSPEWILLCDECDCGYHCSCLKPIIFLIPSGNWFCPLCCQKKLVTSLEDQLTQLDTMIHNIETAELRKQRQKLAEITEQNILQERRKNNRLNASREKSVDSKKSSGSSGSDESSEDAPLKDYFYKLRKRNEKAAPSYRFNEYDDLMNHAINRGMDDTTGAAGNLGRGKDISTIIDADDDNEEEKPVTSETEKPAIEKEDGAESSGSDVIRPKKISKGKKKSRKLNQLDVSSDDERVSDVDFKGTSSSDSEVDEEDLSMSSVSESSLDLPSRKGKGRNIRKSTRNREKKVDRRFINDNDSDSDDEPLIKAKRTRKKKDSDEEEFDVNDDEDDEGSLAEEIDSEDLCDDTDTDDSSEGNWPRKKKKRVASYDIKPRKAPKKNDDEDKAFRAGISKKKVLKKSDNESDGSVSESEKGKRKTRGKKLLYLIEDDLDSDESDGIKPGVKRPETPPEEREMFVKKQEEIKRMLAAKDTEAAKKLAAPTIEPIHFSLEKPISPPPIPFSNEPASLSTIPKNVIESAKALDTDYNRIKPVTMGSQLKSNDGNLQSNDMNEEELARMMEEEDFAQHQLKLAGEAIARSKKLLELEAKEGEFAAFTKVSKEKEWIPPVETKKRSRKSKSSEKTNESFPGFSKALHGPQNTPPMPPLVSSNTLQLPKSLQHQMPSQPSIIANLIQQQSGFPPSLSGMTNERPSVLSTFLTRPDLHPQLLKMHQPIPPEAFNQKIQHILPEAYILKNQQVPPEAYTSKNQQLPPEMYDPKHQSQLSQQQLEESEEKKRGRRKKFTPLRTDLVEGNLPKQAKFDQPSVIMPTNPAVSRGEDKSKAPRPDHPKLAVAAPPQIFNPATNPTPSVITRLLQPQQRGGSGPFPQGFTESGQPVVGNPGLRPYPEDMKNVSPGKVRAALQQPPMGTGLPPQGSFGENPFVPRNLHQLYRGPPGYGVIPPHARLPPYPFHHLHPNLRPEFSSPYNMPPQFSYYAPPAHSRQPQQPSAIPLNHGAPQLVPAGNEDVANSIRNANNSEEPSETSEFGGLVSYFSSQQELD